MHQGYVFMHESHCKATRRKDAKMVTAAKTDTLQIEQMELGPFGTNAYILTCRQTGSSVVVDAPGEAEKMLEGLKDTHPQYILMTHSHMDHVGALAELKSALKIPVAAHRADAGKLPAASEMLLQDGDVLYIPPISKRNLKSVVETVFPLATFLNFFGGS